MSITLKWDVIVSAILHIYQLRGRIERRLAGLLDGELNFYLLYLSALEIVIMKPRGFSTSYPSTGQAFIHPKS